MYLKRILLPALLIFNLVINAQNTPSYVPTDGLVGWWPFSGNAIDSSGTGNNGIVVNTLLTTDRFGNANSAYSYNGVNSRIEILETASLNCKKLTISVWVFNNNILKTSQIIYKGSLNADAEAYALYSTNNHLASGIKINSNCIPGIGWVQTITKQKESQGSWENFIVTFDGTVYKTYKNGILDTTSSTIGLIDVCPGGGLRFGYSHNRNNSSGDSFDGVIDDIGIWNRALTQNEINQLYSVNTVCNNTGNLGVNVCLPERSLHVKDVIRLEPRSFSPPNPSKGDLYFDGTINKLRCYDGTAWRDCW